MSEHWAGRVEPPLFDDRCDAGRQLAAAIGPREGPLIVDGLARGGVPVAAEVARALGAPLDALVVRKIGHPEEPELALGALARGHVVLLDDLGDAGEGPPLSGHVEAVAEQARRLDASLHAQIAPLDPGGAICLLVDDGLATGASMTAACRWARAHDAAEVVVAVPVAASETLERLAGEADEVVCPHPIDDFGAVSPWYRDFSQVSEREVIDAVQGVRT